MLHDYVKKRIFGGVPFFHVRKQTVINGRKVTSQSYFHYDDQSYSHALLLANKKASHYELRHSQLRRARSNRPSFCSLFFNQHNALKYFNLRKVVRSGRSTYFEMSCQISVDGKQVRLTRSLIADDPEFLFFDLKFNELFRFFSGHTGLFEKGVNVPILKSLARSCLMHKYIAFSTPDY